MNKEENTEAVEIEVAETGETRTEAVEAETTETEEVETETVEAEPETTEPTEPENEKMAEDATEKVSEAETSQAEKKNKKGLIITLVSVAAGILILLGVYLGISTRYQEAFLMGTIVNGKDCSGLTIDEVEAVIQSIVEEYTLEVVTRDGETEQIKGTDIGITYIGYKQIKEELEKQNPYLWPKALFSTNEIVAEIEFEYDAEKLNTVIGELKCMQPENQKAPVNAAVVYQDGAFVIQDEVYGTQLDATKVNEAIHASVTAMEGAVKLEETDCYIQPTYKKDSAEVIAARDEVNKYLSATITYSVDSIELTVDRSMTYQWISVDANMTPVISTDLVKEFAGTLGSKYNTANRGGEITTPTGEVKSVELAGYGRKVGSDAEAEQLISDIKAGTTVTREPVYSQKATPEGENIWGNTYIEVDITAQHMWYIANGEVAMETDVVTGLKGSMDTPTGTYTILEKKLDKTLLGDIVNGKRLYETPVDYWMRVTWSGIGFHDATWQSAFGGDRYLKYGSHGCINMPLGKAAELYNLISVGTPVVIHH